MEPLHSGATEQGVDRGLERYRKAAERALASLNGALTIWPRAEARHRPRTRAQPEQILERVRQPHDT
jgi:hypothetical protein